MRKRQNIFARVFFVLAALFISSFFAAYIYAEDADPTPQPTANFSYDGANYYLDAPDTFTINIPLAPNFPDIELIDGETTETKFSISGGGADVSWTIDFTLSLYYDKAAFLGGDSNFIFGTYTMHQHNIHTPDLPIHTLDGTETIIHQFIISVKSIEEIYTANTIIMQRVYDSVEYYVTGNIPDPGNVYANGTPETLEYEIVLPPEFICMLVSDPTATPEPTPYVSSTPAPTEQPAATAVPEPEQQAQSENTETPSKAEVVAAAVTSGIFAAFMGTVAVNAASSAGAGAAAGSSSAAGSVVNVGIQQSVQNSAFSAATADAGRTSFLKDILAALRDMITDEARSHGSGKVSEALDKEAKKPK